MPTGFTREELQAYARSQRSDYEGVLKKIVEIPSVSVEPERKDDTRRAAEYAVSLLQSFGASARLYETKGHPIVHGRFDRDPKYPTMTPMPPGSSRWTLTLNECMRAPRKSSSMVLGARPTARADASALSSRTGPVMLSGVASGGFEVSGVMALVTGWSDSSA